MASSVDETRVVYPIRGEFPHAAIKELLGRGISHFLFFWRSDSVELYLRNVARLRHVQVEFGVTLSVLLSVPASELRSIAQNTCKPHLQLSPELCSALFGSIFKVDFLCLDSEYSPVDIQNLKANIQNEGLPIQILVRFSNDASDAENISRIGSSHGVLISAADFSSQTSREIAEQRHREIITACRFLNLPVYVCHATK